MIIAMFTFFPVSIYVIEFYKIFWNDIKTLLINSLNHSYNNENLTTLQKQGILSLIPNPGKKLKILKTT